MKNAALFSATAGSAAAGAAVPSAASRRPTGGSGRAATRNADQAAASRTDGRTRDRVVELLLEWGSATAAELACELGVSPAGIRRHLDALLAEGLIRASEQPRRGPRGRGRPAKRFALTEAARETLPHLYDDIATAALRWIADRGGDAAIAEFAAAQVATLEERCRAAIRAAGENPIARAEALAAALTAEGYAANASAIAAGGQLCQHHCPVAHVAAEFPQLCEAETEVISRVIGTHVQRLATIAHGDGVCTTYIPDPRRVLPIAKNDRTGDPATVRTDT
ncbi:helix-turn-helix transcriptional regulator [Rhizomonospora bruguierae]|uniref:helix-turn-helix transcriptional regulator n=1 Tax=Rhizomonospora bruguierae TaxID=1581705 RepID=UPI0024BE03BD|nr:ArsR family transcriptional regulator [Micromonospora sp. NBRC 107566]